MTLAHNHLLIFHDIIINYYNFMRNVLYMGRSELSFECCDFCEPFNSFATGPFVY